MVSFTEERSRERQRVIDGIRLVEDLVNAGREIVAGQLGIGGLSNISTDAGRLLVEVGAAGTLDDGIVLFHERVGRDKPGLRRTLARLDRRAGRLPKVKRSPAQRAHTQAVKAGLVVRDRATGRLKGLSKKGKAMVARVNRAARLKREGKQKKRQGEALKKLRGFGLLKR